MTTTEVRTTAATRLYLLVAEWPGGWLTHHVVDAEHAVLFAEFAVAEGWAPSNATWRCEM